MRTAEWMTAEQAATYLGYESVEAFEKIATREASPNTTSRPAPHGTTAPSSTLGSWVAGERRIGNGSTGRASN